MEVRVRQQAVPPLRVEPEWWVICAIDCALVSVALWFASWLIPARVPLLELVSPMAVLTIVVSASRRAAAGSSALARWLFAYGFVLISWFAWARVHGPWTALVICALVLAYLAFAASGPTALARDHVRDRVDADAEDRARQRKELAKWVRRFSRWGVPLDKDGIKRVVRNENGLEVHGRLGGGSDEHGIITFDVLRNKALVIATDLGIGAGSVNFEQPDPDDAAVFVMHLKTRKGKRPVVYLPDDARVTSVNDPFALGQHDNGRPYRLRLREIVVMIIGVIGSGKSNLLNVFIGQVARCEDALIFCIDLKGGRMARPWIMPWLEGRVERPVIDWLATTRAQALTMLEALIRGGEARSESGAGGEKIKPRRDRPAVILIIDESVVALGHNRRDDGISSQKIAVKLAQVVETYRSEAFSPVIAGVRGDVETMGLSAIKAQALARIGLRVSQSMDGDRVFGDNHAAGLALSRITDDGAGLVEFKGKMSSPVHFYRMTPKLAYRRAMATARLRPQPDPVLRAGLGEPYEQRWEVMADLLDKWRQGAAEWREEAEIGEVPDLPRVRDTAVPVSAPGDDTNEMFAEIIAQLEDPEDSINPARKRMRELLIAAKAAGYTSGALAKQLRFEAQQTGTPELAVHRNTIIKWLRDDESNGWVRSKGRKPNDPYARWIWIRQDSQEEVV